MTAALLLAPLFKFGIIGDVQTADIPDGPNFARTKTRRYRQSLACLREASSAWNEVAFCVQLGDLLDSKAAPRRWETLAAARGAMGQHDWHVATGNHDLACFDRDELRAIAGRDLYYDWTPAPGFRCCLMDAYALSVLQDERAAQVLSDNNPNILAEDPTRPSCAIEGGWLKGLREDQYRWVPYNGAFDDAQLHWFRGVLKDADAKGERVIAFSHAPVYRPASKPNNCAWDSEAILKAADDTPDVLVAWFAGHDHDGGYARRTRTEHHLTPAAPLECDLGQVSYGTVDVFADRAHINWVGKRPASPTLPWPDVIQFS